MKRLVSIPSVSTTSPRYCLQRCASDGTVLWEQKFSTLEDLACSIYSVTTNESPDERDQDEGHWHAVTPKGQWLAVAPLAAYGQRLWFAFWQERRFGPGFWRAYTFRAGPVPRIRCRRGGPTRRYAHTQQARREADFWLPEEGEMPVRAKRAAKALPTSWDDFPNQTERSWKSQRKGRKSWDRR